MEPDPSMFTSSTRTSMPGALGMTARTASELMTSRALVKDVLMGDPITVMQALYWEEESPHYWLKPVLHLLQDAGRALEVIKRLITREVDASKSPETMFRVNSLSTFALSHYAQTAGRSFLMEVVRPIVLFVLASPFSFTVDCDPAEAASNAQHVFFVAEHTFRSLREGAAKLPLSIREVCAHLKAEVLRKYPESSSAAIAIGGFIFLRFICPCIATPHRFGITNTTPSESNQRKLVVLSKVLQNLSNQRQFNQSSLSYLNALWITPYKEDMHQLQESFTEPVGMSDRYPPVDNHDFTAVHRLLYKHAQAIKDAVRAEPDCPKSVMSGLQRVEALKQPPESALMVHKSRLRENTSLSYSDSSYLLSVYPEYSELLWLFLYSKNSFARAMYTGVPHAQRHIVCKFCVELLGHGSSVFEDFVKSNIERSVSVCVRPSELFRDQNLFVQVSITYACDSTAARSFQKAMMALLTREMDSLPAEEDIETCSRMLAAACLSYVRENILRLPSRVVLVCQHLRKIVEQKFPNQGPISVGGFFFLRYLCPLITKDAMSLPTNDHNRKLMLGVSKLLQKLANRTKFNDAESLSASNDFLSSNQTHMDAIIDAVSDPATLAALGSTPRLSRTTSTSLGHSVSRLSLKDMQELFLRHSEPIIAACGKPDVEEPMLGYKLDVAIWTAHARIQERLNISGSEFTSGRLLPDELSEEDWGKLLAQSEVVSHDKGGVALEEGAHNTSLFRVVSGSYNVVVSGNVVATLKPRSVFGELSFLGRRKTMCPIVAGEDGSSVRVIRSSFIILMLETDPEIFARFYFNIAKILARRLTGGRSNSLGAKEEKKAPQTQRKSEPGDDTKDDGQLAQAHSPIAQFPCKLGKSGQLFIFPKNIVHISRMFGLEKKASFNVSSIENLSQWDATTLIMTVGGKKKKIHFSSAEVCGKALRVLSVLCEEETQKSPAARRTSSETRVCHAICVSENIGTRPQQLTMKKGDVVIVVLMGTEEWWGIVNGVHGRFPKSCVELMVDLDYSQALADSGFFDTTHLPSSAEWNQILAYGKEQVFRSGDVIIPQGFPMASLFQIITGECEVRQTNVETEEETVVANVSNGSTVGELSFILEEKTAASVIATSDEVHCFVLDGEGLKAYFAEEPILAGKFFKYLAVTIDRWLRMR